MADERCCLWFSLVISSFFFISTSMLINVVAQVLGGKEGRMKRSTGVRTGQLQHLLLHFSSHFILGVSASPSRRNVECVGESDLQLTLVVRKRMLAFTRCLWITERKSFSSTLLLPGHLFQGGQKHQRSESQGCNERTIGDRCITFWSNKEDSVSVIVWWAKKFFYTGDSSKTIADFMLACKTLYLMFFYCFFLHHIK